MKFTAIRGNASEIIALAKLWKLIEDTGGQVRGVDSTEKVSSAKESAVALAKFTGGAVAVSGEEDFVTDGKEKISCEVAREINEEFSALCKKFPDKFGFVATLPMPSVEGSISEIKFATEKLGALGVKVASNSDGIYLGDEILNPIFEELNCRKSLGRVGKLLK